MYAVSIFRDVRPGKRVKAQNKEEARRLMGLGKNDSQMYLYDMKFELNEDIGGR